MSGRARSILALLVLLRVAIPLVALAGSGHDLAIFPPYRYEPLNGDATGFYAAARELMAAGGRVAAPLLALAAVAVLAASGAAVVLWRRGRTWLAALLPAMAIGLVLVLPIREMSAPGAAVIGWPALWAALMLPYRAVGLALDPDVAFVFGLTASLAATAATTVATAYAGYYATGRRSVGLVAAALFAAWPLATGPLTGERAWENGQWNVDVGLHLYTEPLSTALVTTAVALLLRTASGQLGYLAAGLLLGLGTLTKLTNGLVAAALVLAVAFDPSRGLRRAVPLVAGGLVSLPAIVAYWPLGYGPIYEETGESAGAFWSVDAVGRAWRDSLLFTPLVQALAACAVLLGCLALRSRPFVLACLLAPIVVTALVYSFYTVTAVHPRFLYVALPPLFVLAASGGSLAVRTVASSRRLGHAAEP